MLHRIAQILDSFFRLLRLAATEVYDSICYYARKFLRGEGVEHLLPPIRHSHHLREEDVELSKIIVVIIGMKQLESSFVVRGEASFEPEAGRLRKDFALEEICEFKVVAQLFLVLIQPI